MRQFPRDVAEEAKRPLDRIERTPLARWKNVHEWADYVELRCLSSADGDVARDEVANWLRLDHSETPDSDEVGAVSAEDLDVAQPEDDVTAAGLAKKVAGTGVEGTGRAARNSDNRHQRAADIFALLVTRASLHGESYPFELSKGGDRISIRELKPVGRELYAFLLLCASGRYVNDHGKFAKDFERLCVPVLRAMLPTADVNIFGTADSGGPFRGKFRKKLKALAKHVGEPRQQAAKSIGSEEMGDRGLDIVGMVSMGDDLSGRLTVFAQAACTRKWVEKQHSASPRVWDQLIRLTSPAVVVCLIPFCFRKVSGNWHDSTLIQGSVLLDRGRILHWLLKGDPSAAVASLTQRSVIAEVVALGVAA